MNKNFILLGVDPSLSNMGLCLTRCHKDNGIVDILDLKLIKTSPSAEKGKKNKHDLERARAQWRGMQPYLDKAEYVAAETPQIAGDFMQSRSIWTSGIMFGILATIPQDLIQVSPMEVKLAATGNKKATKDDMMAWAFALFPDAPWLYKKIKGVRSPVQNNEHIADALGVVKAGFNKLIESNFKTIT